jgi:hypothetical protein
MTTLLTVLGMVLLAVCLIAAYAYLIIINRENEMPGIEDIDSVHEKN